jgi:hypothetical protein
MLVCHNHCRYADDQHLVHPLHEEESIPEPSASALPQLETEVEREVAAAPAPAPAPDVAVMQSFQLTPSKISFSAVSRTPVWTHRGRVPETIV